MDVIQLRNKNGVTINVNLSTVDSVRTLGKAAKTCFLNIGPVEVEVKGAAKVVAKQITRARGHSVQVVAARLEEIEDGPFDKETGLAVDSDDKDETWELGIST